MEPILFIKSTEKGNGSMPRELAIFCHVTHLDSLGALDDLPVRRLPVDVGGPRARLQAPLAVANREQRGEQLGRLAELGRELDLEERTEHP